MEELGHSMGNKAAQVKEQLADVGQDLKEGFQGRQEQDSAQVG